MQRAFRCSPSGSVNLFRSPSFSFANPSYYRRPTSAVNFFASKASDKSSASKKMSAPPSWENLTQEKLFKSEAKLKDLPVAKYSKPASADAVEKTRKALVEKGHDAVVVGTKQEALEHVKKYIPKGASVMNAGSMTLNEIGFMDYLKAQSDWVNLHGAMLAEPDQAKAAELRRKSMQADYFVSSVTAITEQGDLTVCDLTGSRTGAFTFSGGHVVVIAGSQKIVPSYDDAVKRTYDYCLPLESVRANLVYGVPGSAVNNFVAIRGSNPWGGKGRFHVIIVNELTGY